jgi:hypothetical protein
MAKIASSITLPPEAQRALRGKVVEWAVVASLATALVFGGLWTWSSREAARVGLDRTASVSFQLAATLLMQVLEAAGSEAMRSAEAPAMAAILLGPGRSAADQALQVAAATRSELAAFVLLDRQGVPVAWTEDDPAVAELAAQLQPRSATDADLDYVMRGVALRKELAGAKPGATRALELKGSMRLVASAPVRDAMGSVVGSLHGVVGFEALAGALTLDPSPLGTRLLLLDGNGTTVASGAAARGLRWSGLEPGIGEVGGREPASAGAACGRVPRQRRSSRARLRPAGAAQRLAPGPPPLGALPRPAEGARRPGRRARGAADAGRPSR